MQTDNKTESVAQSRHPLSVAHLWRNLGGDYRREEDYRVYNQWITNEVHVIGVEGVEIGENTENLLGNLFIMDVGRIDAERKGRICKVEHISALDLQNVETIIGIEGINLSTHYDDFFKQVSQGFEDQGITFSECYVRNFDQMFKPILSTYNIKRRPSERSLSGKDRYGFFIPDDD
jgi:hypothetical protein